jgi:hypothetical protein
MPVDAGSIRPYALATGLIVALAVLAVLGTTAADRLAPGITDMDERD